MLLKSANLPEGAVVLDPWNGSGTSSYVASRLGYNAIGLDLNPAMVVIARARMLPSNEADSLLPVAKTILAQRSSKFEVLSDDPLEEWFDSETAQYIRQLEFSIRHSTVGTWALYEPTRYASRLSGLTATMYLALFAACRGLTTTHRSSNPTWMRKPKKLEEKSTSSRAGIAKSFLAHVDLMARALAETKSTANPNWKIEIADTTMDLKSVQVDAVVTSPPYCTRIDYTAATRIELAILAPLLHSARDDLSRRMVGSIRVPDKEVVPKEEWGDLCNEFLTSVKKHPSKASSTYYFKTHADYYQKLYRSVANVSEVLKVGGFASFVVQDSYYKEIHNDLPAILSEMCAKNNLILKRRDNFPSKRSMASVNRHARIYSRSSTPVEAVLSFERVG